MSDFPKWIEPAVGHGVIRGQNGILSHTTGLQFHADRATGKVTVLVANAEEERKALVKLKKKSKDEEQSVSMAGVIDELNKVRENFPTLFGSELEQLASKVREFGSLDDYAHRLQQHVADRQAELDRVTARLGHAQEEMNCYIDGKKQEAIVEANKITAAAHDQARVIIGRAKQQLAELTETVRGFEDQRTALVAAVTAEQEHYKQLSQRSRDFIASKKQEALLEAVKVINEANARANMIDQDAAFRKQQADGEQIALNEQLDVIRKEILAERKKLAQLQAERGVPPPEDAAAQFHSVLDEFR